MVRIIHLEQTHGSPRRHIFGFHRKAQLRTVTLGRDFGTTVEVTSGLDASERVISNPGDAIAPGDAVRVVENPPGAGKPSGAEK